MCNHYRAGADWRERMDDWSETKVRIRFDPARPARNLQGPDLYPGHVGEVLVAEGDRIVAAGANWCFMPASAKVTWAEWIKTRRGCNNARGEEADKKWPFVFVAKSGRCLIPGEAFFEWDDGPVKGKTEYRFARPDGRPFFFAGLCGMAAPSDAGEILTYTMVTKAAGGDTASIGHPRQPIVLRPDELDAWMDPANPVAAFAQTPDPAGTFTLQAVKGPKAMA
jgi:putative SOS response-associated peptidase YedK